MHGIGLTHLTFCPFTGKINRNLLADGPLTAANPGLAIFNGLHLHVSSLSWSLIYCWYYSVFTIHCKTGETKTWKITGDKKS